MLFGLLERFDGLNGRLGRALAVSVVAVVAGGSAAWVASATTRPVTSGPVEKKEPDTTPKLRRVGTDDIVVPAEVRASLCIKTAPASTSTRKRNLPSFQGTLNFDSNRLARVQSPFAGPVVELGQVADPIASALPGSLPAKACRAIKVGDKVNKGDVLAVVWSADLGAKKSELVDAVSRLKADEINYERQRDLYEMNGGTTERSVREAERTVQQSRVAVEKAEATLLAWRIPAEDIKSLRKEADLLSKPDAKRTDPAKWARVEIKAPLDGVVLEKSVVVGQVVDTTTDLFRVGDLSALAVWVHVYEEDLPLLRGVPTPTPWIVSVPAMPGTTYSGRLEQVGASIDPSQHTALVTGTVQNSSGDLRAGMAVTVAVELPPATGEVEVPAESVIEDGRESFVFVRTDPSGDTFVRRPVAVVRRSRETIALAARADGVKAGDSVVTAGSLLLGDAFGDLPQPKP